MFNMHGDERNAANAHAVDCMNLFHCLFGLKKHLLSHFIFIFIFYYIMDFLSESFSADISHAALSLNLQLSINNL